MPSINIHKSVLCLVLASLAVDLGHNVGLEGAMDIAGVRADVIVVKLLKRSKSLHIFKIMFTKLLQLALIFTTL